jgi:excisionase family DNA binding protein
MTDMPTLQTEKDRTWQHEDILTLPEAAAYLRVGEAELTDLAAKHRVPAQLIGDEWRFLKRALDDWLHYSGDLERLLFLPRKIAPLILEDWMVLLENRLLEKLKASPRPGSKEAVLRHFGALKDDEGLEEQLANLRAQREAT